MAAKMLASALLVEGKHVASFPMYGFERRGAPVVAFTRFDDKPIREKTQIYNPDCIIVIDPGLLTLPTLFTGLKPASIFLLNTAKKEYKQPNEALKTGGLVNATGIAVQEVGRDIPNTCLLGAFAAVTGWPLSPTPRGRKRKGPCSGAPRRGLSFWRPRQEPSG